MGRAWIVYLIVGLGLDLYNKDIGLDLDINNPLIFYWAELGLYCYPAQPSPCGTLLELIHQK